eukprot:UN02161
MFLFRVSQFTIRSIFNQHFYQTFIPFSFFRTGMITIYVIHKTCCIHHMSIAISTNTYIRICGMLQINSS